MNTWLILYSILSSYAWDCGISMFPHPFLLPDFPQAPENFERSDTLAPIRLTFYEYNLDLGESSSYFHDTILDSVQNFFQSVLKVYPLKSNLILSDVSDCGDEVIVPLEHQTIGVQNTDLIIYLTSINSPEESFVAYAGACAIQDTGLNNVIAGRVVINTPQFETNSFEAQITLVIHEITHLLGFSSILYDYFHKPDGTLYTKEEMFIEEEVRGAIKTLVRTPTVLEEVRKAFACDTLEGLELESSGNTGSHWDMRVAYNDFMISHVTTDPIFSSFTFALLKDTGWYDINWNYVQMPIFGYKKGCSFHTERCVESGVANFEEFCTEKKDRCDIFHLYKGVCNIGVYEEELPPEYQYFDDPRVGGLDKFMDYCPIMDSYSDGSCRGNGELASVTYDFFGETVCPNCRCLEGTLLQQGWITSSDSYHTGCYEVTECHTDYAMLQVGNEETGYHSVRCPFEGGNVTVPGFNGYLVCPSSDILCGRIPCMNACYGHGICVHGRCACQAGRGGVDCSVKCMANCNTCEDSQSCNTCSDEFRKPELMCQCGDDFVEVDYGCQCIKSSCMLCKEYLAGECSLCKENASVTEQGCACNEGYYFVEGECLSNSFLSFTDFK